MSGEHEHKPQHSKLNTDRLLNVEKAVCELQALAKEADPAFIPTVAITPDEGGAD